MKDLREIKRNKAWIIAGCLAVAALNILLLAGELCMAFFQSPKDYINAADRPFTQYAVEQKHISLVDAMPDLPAEYELIDWQERANGFVKVAFDGTLTDGQDFLPLFKVSIADKKRMGVIPPFVGLDTIRKPSLSATGKPNDYKVSQSEAITFINSVLLASLMGEDMSDVNGENYVSMCLQFINREQILLNWLGGSSLSGGMWHMTLPTLYLFSLADLYPGLSDVQKACRILADKYYSALVVLGGGTQRGLDMDITSFDFARMAKTTEYPEWSGRQPDSAVTIGVMMYWAYRRWGDEKFLEGSIWCADYMEQTEENPLFEIAMVYCPYLMAMLNAEAGRNYDISKQFEKILSTTTDVRPGFGFTNAEINTEGGKNPALYAVFTSDGEPYYWSMNGAEGSMAFIPTVLYDQSYADAVGKFILNSANSHRYYFDDGPLKDRRNKAATFWTSEWSKYIPFEALHWMTNDGTHHVSYEPITEDAELTLTGDPVHLNWDYQTEYSMYSGASVGKFGAVVYRTNVEGILQVDLSKLDYMRTSASYQTYLYYNPHGEEQTVQINLGYRYYDLYDSVSDSFVKKNATGMTEFTVPASGSVCLVLAPQQSVRRKIDRQIYLNDAFVALR